MAMIKHNERSLRNRYCRKCGAQIYYWGHDTESTGRAGARFCNEHGSSSWAALNSDESRHVCGESPREYDGDADTEFARHEDNPRDETPAIVRSSVVEAAPSVANDALMAALGPLADLLRPLLGAKVDETQVRSIVTDMLAGVSHPLRVEVKQGDEIIPVNGNVHHMLPKVIMILGAGLHAMMVGPAGTGKSTIASQAAEGLGLKHYSISLSPQTPASAILGYMTATGDYVRSLFREAYEHGGVFHFDEIDNSHPSTLAIVNAALANGEMGFPDGMVKRHPDFRVLASANTYGRGPDRAYVGRQAIDAATLDRFTVVSVDVDEALEESLCMATGLDITRVKRVLIYVRHLRAKAADHKLPLTFSPRASHGMCALIQAGFTVSEAIEMRARRGISDADWMKVSNGVLPLSAMQ
jgi:cobaltochelatase CobS